MVISLSGPVIITTANTAGTVMENWINFLTIIVLTAALFVLLLADSRRLIILAYCGVLLMIFTINIQFWTFGFALSKLLTGSMAVLMLALVPDYPDKNPSGLPGTGKVFSAVGLGFGIILILFTINKTSDFLAITPDQVIPSLFVLFCGFIMLGISQESFRIIIGLLTLLAGFQILYGAVEQSLLINGLLAAVELLVALVGSYLLMPAAREGEE